MFEKDLQKIQEMIEKLRKLGSGKDDSDSNVKAFIGKIQEYLETVQKLKITQKITKTDFENLKILHLQIASWWKICSQSADLATKDLATDIATLTARHCRALDLLHPAFCISKKTEVSFREYILRLDNPKCVPTEIIEKGNEICKISINDGKKTTTNLFIPETSPAYKSAVALHTIAGLLGVSARVPTLVYKDFQGIKGVIVADITDLHPLCEMKPSVKKALTEKLSKHSDLGMITQMSMLNTLEYLISPLTDNKPVSILVKQYDDGNFAIKGCTWKNTAQDLRQHRTIQRTQRACANVRQTAQKSLAIRQDSLRIFVQPDEIFDGAICARELCGVALSKSNGGTQSIKFHHIAFLPQQFAANVNSVEGDALAYRFLGLGLDQETVQKLSEHCRELKACIGKYKRYHGTKIAVLCDTDFHTSQNLIRDLFRESEKDPELRRNNLFLRICSDLGVDLKNLLEQKNTSLNQAQSKKSNPRKNFHPTNAFHPILYSENMFHFQNFSVPFALSSSYPKKDTDKDLNFNTNRDSKISFNFPLNLSNVTGFYPEDYLRKNNSHNESEHVKQASVNNKTAPSEQEQLVDNRLKNTNPIHIEEEPDHPGGLFSFNENLSHIIPFAPHTNENSIHTGNPFHPPYTEAPHAPPMPHYPPYQYGQPQMNSIATYYAGYLNNPQPSPYVSQNSGNYLSKAQFFQG